MTTPRIEELVETATEWLAQRDPRLVPAEIAYHKTYKDHLAGLITQAHQAGIDEAVGTAVHKIQTQINYYSGSANDGGRIDERLATLLWCKHAIKALQDNK